MPVRAHGDDSIRDYIEGTVIFAADCIGVYLYPYVHLKDDKAYWTQKYLERSDDALKRLRELWWKQVRS